MNRNRLIAIGLAVAVVAFLAGFVPQWLRAKRANETVQAVALALSMSRTEGKIAAALTESLRSNYERSRQLMTEVYDEIETLRGAATPAQRTELDAILAERDEMITLLARAAPESSQRLMLVHTRYRTSMTGGGITVRTVPRAPAS